MCRLSGVWLWLRVPVGCVCSIVCACGLSLGWGFSLPVVCLSSPLVLCVLSLGEMLRAFVVLVYLCGGLYDCPLVVHSFVYG